MKRIINDANELLEVLKKNKIIIYGAGYVAERFYKSLKKKNIDKNVICFATTKREQKIFCDLPVVAIDDLSNNNKVIICIAVHESIKDDIIELLKVRGFDDYIWIYPFQYQLMLGAPVRKSVRVPLKDIVLKGNVHYGMTIRYLAIEQFYGKNEIGYEVYVRAWAMSCGIETAKARLRKFIELIENWERYGYDESRTSSILENNEVIDGTHRVMLAIYKKMDYIVCDIYPEYEEGFNVHTNDANMTRESLEKADFTKEEFDVIEKTRQRINKQYRIG